MKNSAEIPQKTNNRAITWYSNPTHRYIFGEKNENRNSKTCMFIAALFTSAKIGKQSKCLSTDEWIMIWIKMVCVYNEHYPTRLVQIGKGVRQGCILSPSLFNLYAGYIMRNTGLEEAQAGIKIAREISVTSDMQMTPPLWQKVKRN